MAMHFLLVYGTMNGASLPASKISSAKAKTATVETSTHNILKNGRPESAAADHPGMRNVTEQETSKKNVRLCQHDGCRYTSSLIQHFSRPRQITDQARA